MEARAELALHVQDDLHVGSAEVGVVIAVGTTCTTCTFPVSTCMHLKLISIGVCRLWAMRGCSPYSLLHICRQNMQYVSCQNGKLWVLFSNSY